AIAGDEYVGDEEVVEIVRDGQLSDRRIGNGKGEPSEYWSRTSVAGISGACDPEAEIPCDGLVESPSESLQAPRDGVQWIGGGLVNDVSRARTAVELEELLVRRPPFSDSFFAGPHPNEID